MKTLNMIFVDRRLASSTAISSQSCENKLTVRPNEWLSRLNFLRSICFVPAADPFQAEPFQAYSGAFLESCK